MEFLAAEKLRGQLLEPQQFTLRARGQERVMGQHRAPETLRNCPRVAAFSQPAQHQESATRVTPAALSRSACRRGGVLAASQSLSTVRARSPKAWSAGR